MAKVKQVNVNAQTGEITETLVEHYPLDYIPDTTAYKMDVLVATLKEKGVLLQADIDKIKVKV